MPSAWTQNYYHMVFSTKGRIESITPDLESRLDAFMGGVLRERKCSLLAVNGMSDHVHLLVRYPSDLSHSDMLRHVKARSSKWVHQTFPTQKSFKWQEGYGGFTVSASVVTKVKKYIADQKKHHREMSFVEEVKELARLHEIEIDLDMILN